MKKYLGFFVAIIAVFIPFKSVNAASICDDKNASDYKYVASNVNVIYTYKMIDDKPVFTITFTNLFYGNVIKDNLGHRYTYMDFQSETELSLDGYSDNQRLTFYIYENDCGSRLLATKYVTLPKYNSLSTDPICKGVENYSLCQRWGEINVSYDEFVKKVTAYKESKKKIVVEEKPFVAELSLRDKIFRFVGKYYVYLVSAVVLVILFLAALKSVSLKKNQFDFKV